MSLSNLKVQGMEMSNSSDIMDLLEGCGFGINTNWQALLHKLELTVDDVRGLKSDSTMEGVKEAFYRGLDIVVRRKKKTWHDLILAIKKTEPQTAERLMKLKIPPGAMKGIKFDREKMTKYILIISFITFITFSMLWPNVKLFRNAIRKDTVRTGIRDISTVETEICDMQTDTCGIPTVKTETHDIHVPDNDQDIVDDDIVHDIPTEQPEVERKDDTREGSDGGLIDAPDRGKLLPMLDDIADIQEFCYHLEGMSTATCDKIMDDFKDSSTSQKTVIIATWLGTVKRPTWRDFLRPVALTGGCASVKQLAKEHGVVFEDEDFLTRCKSNQ